MPGSCRQAKYPNGKIHKLFPNRGYISFFFFHQCCVLAAAAKSLQSCLTLCDPRDGSLPGSPRPWDSPGKNTGVGCHFLLQRMKVKSESEVAQSCPTGSDPLDGSPPGSSVHGIFQARVLESLPWGRKESDMTERLSLSHLLSHPIASCS